MQGRSRQTIKCTHNESQSSCYTYAPSSTSNDSTNQGKGHQNSLVTKSGLGIYSKKDMEFESF